MENKITFIVPTVCRPTLDQAIKSIHQQSDNDWYTLVVCDGIDPLKISNHQRLDDDRISLWKAPRTASASRTRQFGVEKAKTEWVGFLDDDDILNPEYVSHWKMEKNDVDVIIFKMTNYGNNIPSGKFIEHGNVGISFCLRKEILDTIEIPEPPSEDYVLLKRLEVAGARIHYSDYVAYHVRPWLEGIYV